MRPLYIMHKHLNVNFASYKATALIAGPLILSNISQPLLGAVDTAVLGHLPNPAYLAAIAIAATVFSYFTWGFSFIRVGTLTLTAQISGGRDKSDLVGVLYRALILGFFIGSILILLHAPLLQFIYHLFDTSDEIKGFVGEYYKIRIMGAPATFLTFAAIGWFLGLGKAHLTLYLQLFINGLNIILDYLFVIEWGLSIAGAGLATCIAEYAGLLLAVIFIIRLIRQDNIQWRYKYRDILVWAIYKKLMIFNVNLMIRTFLLLACFSYFTMIGARLGPDILALNAVLINFFTFASFALDGIADATQTLVGRAVGAKNIIAFKKAVRVAFILAAIMAFLACFIYALLYVPIIHLLTSISDIRLLSYDYAIWLIILPMVSVWCFVFDGVFLGAGAHYSGIIRNAMVIVFIVYILAMQILLTYFYNHGLWASLHVLMIVRALILWYFYPKIKAGMSQGDLKES